MVNQSGGIFDQTPKVKQAPQTAATEQPRKQDFKTPEQQASDMMRRSQMVSKAAAGSAEARAEAKQQEAIDQINSSIGGNSVKENEAAIEELSKISPEDLKLAEAMLFNGYSEMTIPIPNFPSQTITVCTTTPDDIDIVDEMLFEMISENEDKDGKVGISDNIVRSSRNMYNLALSFKGMNGEDINKDKTCQLFLIKKAIEGLYKFEIAGDIKGMAAMRTDIKASIRKRAYMIKRMPTPFVDLISKAKYDFDQKMFNVMSAPNIVSK